MRLIELLKMMLTIPELIEFIKLHSEVINTENSPFSIDENTYMERALLLFDGDYFVMYSLLDKFIDRFYFERMEEYNNIHSATLGYNTLFTDFNGTL